MKIVLARCAAANLLLVAFSAEAFACGTRHFYNKADKTWEISFTGLTTCSIGNVNKSQNRTIPPGQVAGIHYPDFAPLGEQKIRITPGSHWYDIGTAAKPCSIRHSGSTGNVVVNEPADGDVVTCGRGTYPCKW